MSSSTFSVGDLVWAKMKGYPPWPAKITTPPANLKSLTKQKKGHYCCFFFGSENYSLIPSEHICRHGESMVPKTMKRKSVQFRSAVNMIIEQSFKAKVTEDEEIILTRDNYVEMASLQPSTSDITSKPKILKEKLETSMKLKKQDSDVPKRSRRQNSGSKTFKENKVNKNIKIPKRKKRVEKSVEESKIERTNINVDENSPSSSRLNEIPFSHSRDNETQDENLFFIPGFYPDSVPKCTKCLPYIERPTTPEFSINEGSEVIRARNVKEGYPIKKRFGFLGLGFIGRILAKHFLHSGHYLTVWNRTPEKCDEFITAGAHSGQTPADVVAASDITFCCLSNTEAVKSIVFDNCGVLAGMDHSEKGFCVLNTITPFASIEIHNAISKKGGTYLEAFIHGTRSMAENGALLIIAGGAHELFQDCCSCFHSIANNVHYLNCNTGKAAVMNIFLNMLNACIINALASSMSFVSANEGSMSHFLELLKHSRISSSALIKSANAISSKDFSTEMSVKYMQETLNSALKLSNTVYTPTYISSLVHEQYKKASLLRYCDHDASAVFQAM